MSGNTTWGILIFRVFCAFCGVLLGFGIASPAAADSLPLRLGYSDKASVVYLTGNGQEVPAKPGIAIEMAATAAKTCGVAAEFSRYPGGRLLALIGDNTIDGVALLSFSPERLTVAAYPMKGDAADPDFRISSLSYAF